MQTEIQHQKHGQEERRDRNCDHGDNHDNVVPRLIVEGCGNDAADHAKDRANHRAAYGQDDGISVSVGQLRQDRLVGDQGSSHVPLEKACDPVEILHRQGVVQTVHLPHGIQIFLAGAAAFRYAIQQRNGVARNEADHHEHQDGHKNQRGDQLQDSLYNIS